MSKKNYKTSQKKKAQANIIMAVEQGQILFNGRKTVGHK